MTTFVPLAPDSEGTASAAAAADWLLQIIVKENKERANAYYNQFLEQFELDATTGEQHIRDHMQLFELFLSEHALVFEYAAKARQQQQEPQGKKSYAEVLHEVEDFFSLLMAMVVLRMHDPEKAGHAAATFCAVFRSSTEMPEFRLHLLQCLYNAFPPSFPYRFTIFVAALEYAAETKLFHLMLPYVKYISDWMQDWNLTPAAKRQIFLILASELKKLGKSEEAYTFLKRHVQLFQHEKEEILTDGATVSAAAELIEDSIRLPDVMVFDDLVNLHAVQYLAHTSHAELFQLLRLFVNKGPVELESFKQHYPHVFENHGLNYDQCLAKIRLLAIASLVNRGKREMSLKSIADALRVDEAAAEEVAVQAIGQGTIDAKIDQMAKVVHIRSAMQREFGRPQWEELLERLECWQDGVRALLSTMKIVKQQVSAAAAAQASSNAMLPSNVSAGVSFGPGASGGGTPIPAAAPKLASSITEIREGGFIDSGAQDGEENEKKKPTYGTYLLVSRSMIKSISPKLQQQTETDVGEKAEKLYIRTRSNISVSSNTIRSVFSS
ncbi:eukaryotic translation initiation factor 3 subunit M-like [Ochotona princeps]|uniref:eukaryotic translation initiation factor 3 subunit M-like n=1 Tax=Ochotona princeps TaxID=9978 RepID=UPI0027149AD6|nr:eukaryotic translation initiation factor 3 subunit M-like [Ochotona princeps]